jgi:hypothetical protein
MTTIRQLIQTSPARANELFAKLVDTSENAVKTREKLFAELKDELELLASLEEQHLFPVLRKHKDLKDLVREALNDNKATRKLLTELDHTPKDGEEFATRVAELRRVFQQHVRDDKKELLPAVLKALSDEEAEAVVERIEAGKAEIEEAKRAEAKRERERAEAEQARIEAAQRAEAEERRVAARREREEAERVQQAAEVVVNTAWAAPKAAQQAATAAQEVVQSGVSTASEMAQRTTDQVTEVFGAARQRTQDLSARATQSFQAVTQSSAALARGIQEVSGECLEMVQERVQKNLDGVNALVRCRTLPELLAVQTSLIRDNLELTLSNSRRIAELSAQVTENATRTATVQMERSASRTA